MTCVLQTVTELKFALFKLKYIDMGLNDQGSKSLVTILKLTLFCTKMCRMGLNNQDNYLFLYFITRLLGLAAKGQNPC